MCSMRMAPRAHGKSRPSDVVEFAATRERGLAFLVRADAASTERMLSADEAMPGTASVTLVCCSRGALQPSGLRCAERHSD